MNNPKTQLLTPWLVFLMAMTVGVTISSNYYAQPLLHSISTDLHIATENTGYIMMTAQLFYALGLLFITPLGDTLEIKKLILLLISLITCGLLISAFSSNLWMLLIGTAVTGLFSSVAQILIPFAATLSNPNQRGRIVGFLMCGMLLGIALGRTFAGALSSAVSWHTVYFIAAIIMALINVLLWIWLPSHHNKSRINYWQLLASITALYRQERVLRIRSILATLTFAIFWLLWTPFAFLLSDAPYYYSDFIIGLFGLTGILCAINSPIVGRLSDKGKGGALTLIGLTMLLLAWIPLSFAQHSLFALILGVIALDLSVQMTHVSNMNAIYQQRPDARSRMNSGYMTCYFFGGMLGSSSSTYLYMHGGWPVIVTVGFLLSIIGIVVWVYYLKTNHPDPTLSTQKN